MSIGSHYPAWCANMPLRKSSTKEIRVSYPLCSICKKPADGRHEPHIIEPCTLDADAPLSFTISLQTFYDNTASHARMLAKARRELKTYYPDKEFEIIPSRMMLRKDPHHGQQLSIAFVATYSVFEK